MLYICRREDASGLLWWGQSEFFSSSSKVSLNLAVLTALIEASHQKKTKEILRSL
jgi:hypothetical protein